MKIIMPYAVVIAMYFLMDGSGREGGGVKRIQMNRFHMSVLVLSFN